MFFFSGKAERWREEYEEEEYLSGEKMREDERNRWDRDRVACDVGMTGRWEVVGWRARRQSGVANIAIGWSIQGDDSAGWKKPRSLGPLHGGARSRKRGKPYRMGHSATL